MSKRLSDTVEKCACLIWDSSVVQQPAGPSGPVAGFSFDPSDARFLSPAAAQQSGPFQPAGVPSGVPPPPLFQAVAAPSASIFSLLHSSLLGHQWISPELICLHDTCCGRRWVALFVMEVLLLKCSKVAFVSRQTLYFI
jgi:hypothetical protein